MRTSVRRLLELERILGALEREGVRHKVVDVATHSLAGEGRHGLRGPLTPRGCRRQGGRRIPGSSHDD